MRTPSSRSRFRRPGAILALLALAAAAWIAATGLASATTSTSAHRAAKLALVSHDPATVHGTGFKPRTRVRVTFDATLVRRPVTNAQGAFTATFQTVVDRCTTWSVSASQPGRPTVVLRGPAKPECAPASTP